MATPTPVFSATAGDSSGVAPHRAEDIMYDIKNALAMFDPTALLADGATPGGIGTDNLKDDGVTADKLAHGAITDTIMGTRTADPAIAAAYALVGTMTQHVSWFAKTIKALKGVAGNWWDATSKTVEEIWAKFHATTGHKHSGAAGDGPIVYPPGMIHIRAYGATGDGATDDTAAIQAALTAGAGGVVYAPKPAVSYLVSATLRLPNGTLLLGDGAKSTRFTFTGTNFVKPAVDGVAQEGGGLRGIGVLATGGAPGNALDFTGIACGEITDVEVDGFAVGLYFGPVFHHFLTVDRLRVLNGTQYGIQFNGAGAAYLHLSTFSNLYLHVPGGTGIRSDTGGYRCTFINAVCEYCKVAFYLGANCHFQTFIMPYHEAATTLNSIMFDLSAAGRNGRRVYIINPYFNGGVTGTFFGADGVQVTYEAMLDGVCEQYLGRSVILGLADLTGQTEAAIFAGGIRGSTGNMSEPSNLRADRVLLNATGGARWVAYGSAAPIADAHLVGDITFNTAVATGAPVGWVCVTAGTPGTWAAFGNTALTGSVVWDPGNLIDGAGETSADIVVTGAVLGDYAIPAAPYDLQGITCNAYVSAAGKAKIRLQNETGGAIDLASGAWKIRVIKA